MKNLIFCLLLAVVLFGCAQQTGEKGRAVFAMTDDAADMGSVSSVKVTVESVSAHSEADGWVTISSTPKTYDLLQLKAEGSTVVLADVQLEEGTYQQVRLDISSVVVTDAEGEHDAKLPSGELKIVGQLVVNANSTSTATFDFIASESLHVTGNGQYVMAPVVKLETRENAVVELSGDNKVEISGGRVNTNVKVGMNVDGSVGVGLGIGNNQELSIDGGKVKIRGLLGSSSSAGGDASAEGSNSASAESDISADVDDSASVESSGNVDVSSS